MPKRLTDSNSKNIIGKNLMNIRLKKNMSQRDFARFLQVNGLDMDKNLITRIETGKRYVTDIEIKELCRILEIPYTILLDPLKPNQCADTIKQENDWGRLPEPRHFGVF